MVYKVEKHGVRTGNSFKRPCAKYFRQYRKYGCITRTRTQNGDLFQPDQDGWHTNALGDLDVKTDNVEFSINKKGRWNLPKVLQEIILSNSCDADEYGIQMVERHSFSKTSNCISAFSTSGVVRGGCKDKDKKSLTKQSGGYFQANTALNNPPRVTRRQRRYRFRHGIPLEQINNDAEMNAIQTEQNHIRYEIHYPVPKDSFLSRNPKFIGQQITLQYVHNNRKMCHRKRHRRTLKQYIKGCMTTFEQDAVSMECMNDDEFDDSEEEFSSLHENFNYCTELRPITVEVTLHDLVKHAIAANRLTCDKIPRYSNNSLADTDAGVVTKGRVIILEQEAKNENNDTKDESLINRTVEKQESTQLHPVKVIIDNAHVDPLTLKGQFGSDFVECECFPRKFMLNISDQVANFSKSLKLSLNASVVFVHDIDNEINNINENVYKVYLNASFSETVRSVKIETIFDYMETTVCEIVERTVFFIETLPVESFIFQKDSQNFKVSVKESLVEQCAHWSTSSYHPDDKFLLQTFISCDSQVLDRQELSDMGYELVSCFDSVIVDTSDNVVSPRDRFCCICYQLFNDELPGTALAACSHWFCDNCWREYLEIKINNGEVSLRCPEYGCNKVVDSGTIVSLINMRYVIKHAKHRHDTEVERKDVKRWCPNKNCGRILEMNTPDAKFGQCLCGQKICFKCLGPSHWPATCESYEAYHKILKDTGDLGIVPFGFTKGFAVFGKKCPGCHTFVEKNGGCPVLTCVCHTTFCWGCGDIWGSRVHGTDCYKNGVNDKYKTTAKTFEPKNPLKGKKRKCWYKAALQHRLHQHPYRLSKMKSSIKKLTKSIQYYIGKAERNGETINLDFNPVNKSYCHEVNKVNDFLKNVVDMYAEINQIVENIAVLLNFKTFSRDGRLMLQHISQRLSAFGSVIYEIFTHENALPAKNLLEKLIEIRFHSRKTIQSLFRCVKSMEHEYLKDQ